jgi:acetyl-CoA carboxylase biotin carboxyl carrier protein
MDRLEARVEQLAELAKEYGLSEATWSGPSGGVTLRRRAARAAPASSEAAPEVWEESAVEEAPLEDAPAIPKGTPVTSPMAGIFYAGPNPSSPPFVKEGDNVTAGQTIGLIEAMKVFNEVPATVSGTVLKVVAQSGAIVQPGDTLILIG